MGRGARARAAPGAGGLRRADPGGRRSRLQLGDETPRVALVVGVNGVGRPRSPASSLPRSRATGSPPYWWRPTPSAPRPPSSSKCGRSARGVEIVRARSGADPGGGGARRRERGTSRARRRWCWSTPPGGSTPSTTSWPSWRRWRACVARLVPGAPHHTLLVLDATLGRTAWRRRASFNAVLPVTEPRRQQAGRDGARRRGAGDRRSARAARSASLGSGEGLDDWERVRPRGVRARPVRMSERVE
mgnify:CR=1 FL=1